MKRTKCIKIGFVFGTVLLGALTGCVTHVERARVVQDDYVYYPGYQVYYGASQHQYIYQDGRSWVSRPAPPRVAVDVLFASPSVRLDFHDSPAIHHSAVVRQYPRHWAPPVNRDDSRGNYQGERR